MLGVQSCHQSCWLGNRGALGGQELTHSWGGWAVALPGSWARTSPSARSSDACVCTQPRVFVVSPILNVQLSCTQRHVKLLIKSESALNQVSRCLLPCISLGKCSPKPSVPPWDALRGSVLSAERELTCWRSCVAFVGIQTATEPHCCRMKLCDVQLGEWCRWGSEGCTRQPWRCCRSMEDPLGDVVWCDLVWLGVGEPGCPAAAVGTQLCLEALSDGARGLHCSVCSGRGHPWCSCLSYGFYCSNNRYLTVVLRREERDKEGGG